MELKKINPILSKSTNDQYGINLDNDIVTKSDGIYLDNVKSIIATCEGNDVLNNRKSPIKVSDFLLFMDSINLSKMMYLNIVKNKLLTKGIGTETTHLISSPNKSFRMLSSDSKNNSIADSLINKDEVIENQMIEIESLHNSIESTITSIKIDSELSHQIRDKYTVGDYIVFKDCKTKGAPKRITVYSEDTEIAYNKADELIQYGDDLLYYQFINYVTILNDFNNITNDAYGTYIDLTVTLKINDNIYNSNKLIQLTESSQLTELTYQYLYEDCLSIVYDDQELYYDIDPLYTVELYMKTEPAFEAVFNIDRLVLYCKNPDISEYYISSCIVNKMIKNE